MKNECENWLKECIKTFPKLKKYSIICNYKRISSKSLGRVKGTVQTQRTIDPESLLLEGEAKIRIKRKTTRDFKIEINRNLEKIENPMIRKQAVKYVIIHELLHIENKDLLTLSKNYKKRKNKKIHKKDFHNAVLEKFNIAREHDKLPSIKNVGHMELAMNTIYSKVKI